MVFFMYSYTTHAQNIKWTYMWVLWAGDMKWFPGAKRVAPPLILLQESWQWHIWWPASQPLSPALPTVCAHTGLLRDNLFPLSLPTQEPALILAHTCLRTQTAVIFSLLSQPSFPFSTFPFSFVFTLLPLPPFPSPLPSLTCTVTTNELFLVYINSLQIWVEDLEKEILLNKLVYVLRLELKEKESSFLEWHSGQRNTHVRFVMFPVGCT